MTSQENEKQKLDVVLPIRTLSEMNNRDHYMVRAKRFKAQKTFIKFSIGHKLKNIELPCVIELTRIGKRNLDEDNLASSFKAIVDQICDCILPGLAPGQSDSNEKIKIVYKQEKGKEYAIRVNIE